MVVGRGHRHDLLGADRGADRAESGRVSDRARRDDRALADHQPRNRGDRADPAGVRQGHVRADQVIGGQRVRARPVDEIVVGREEVLERQTSGVADHGDHQRAAAVLLLDVNGEAEIDGSVVDAMGRAVALEEVMGHDRQVLGRDAGDRVCDQVRERDLEARVLELAAARVERRHGQRAERGRGRDLTALVHVLREHRRAAADPDRSGRGGGGRRRRGRPVAAVRGGEDVRLDDPAAPRAALHAREVDPLRRGDPLGDGRGLPGGQRRPLVAGLRAGDLRAGHVRRRRGGWGAPLPAALAAAPVAAVIRAITCPTLTVSPASNRISVIVPEAGAGSSMSTLSVEISTTVSPSLTVSPTLTAHSRIVPSVTLSPPVGVTISITRAGAASSAGARRSRRRSGARALRRRRRSRRARTQPPRCRPRRRES